MNRLPVLALVLLCGCSGRSSTPTEAERVRGHWVVVDFHSPKETEDRGQRRKHAIVTEETWSEQFRGTDFEDFEYRLDPSKSPKEIDLIFTAPNAKRLTVRGIYEIVPDQFGDRMRVCLGSAPVVQTGTGVAYVESVRPTAFEPKPGALITYRRKTE